KSASSPTKGRTTKTAAAAKPSIAESKTAATRSTGSKAAPARWKATPARTSKATRARDDDAPDEDVEVEVDAADSADDAEDTTKAGDAKKEGEDEESAGFVYSDSDDDDAPSQQVVTAGATADPVKDYLQQIGKVALLN